MHSLAPQVQPDSNAARQVLQNWQANLAALTQTQPWLVPTLGEVPSDVEWVYARDGSLTALENGRWWSGCSVPLLAGRELLKSLSDETISSCQLAPVHAGLLRASRELMGRSPVLFAAQPDLRTAQMILACHDFSAEIVTRRFWIVTGADWLEQFQRVFIENPGLATPLRFIRTKLTVEDITLPMIKAIQDMFGLVLSARSEEVNRIKARDASTVSTSGTMLLVGGSEFRLWDFGTAVLHYQLSQRQADIKLFDMDDALCGSPLALLSRSDGCGCIVSANICRADANQLISEQVPWITWMTQPGAPPFNTAAPRDSLILADAAWRSIAQAAGWPAHRVQVCGWPASPSPASPGASALGFICDTRKVEIPTAIKDFSSHRLLWDLIEEELAANPLAVEEADAYLSDRSAQLNISPDSLDRVRFIEELIVPVYQQGLARMLIGAGLPVRIWGRGWGDLPEFADKTVGAIQGKADFDAALLQCRALMFCWPRRAAHAIELAGKPIVYRTGADRSALIRAAKSSMAVPPARVTTSRAAADLGELVVKLAFGG